MKVYTLNKFSNLTWQAMMVIYLVYKIIVYMLKYTLYFTDDNSDYSLHTEDGEHLTEAANILFVPKTNIITQVQAVIMKVISLNIVVMML